MKKKLSLIAALGCAMCLLLPQVAQAGGKLDSAIDKLIAQGWPQKIHKQLTTNPRFFNTDIGYRWAGSKADNATAKWLAGQMRAMGLSRVRLERVALDAIDYQGSSVTVGTRKMTASTYGGVRGTPFGGITGNIVYVGQGTAADFDAAGDVSGKIAVVDLALWSKFWTSYPAMEAGLRGAKALIFTRTPAWTAWCSQPDAIGSFDGQAQYASPPLVQVSMQDGEWLKQQLQAGAVTATVENRMSYRFASSGGYGYNVVGEIPGTSNARQLVVIGAHKDCYFKAALDDNSGVTQVLTLAKAMRMTGERPKRTLVFMAFTGEEFARTNCYFDFLGGSTYSITETHPDWPGRVAGMINLEGQGHRGGKLTLRVNPELKTLASTTIAARTDAAPYGFAIQDRATIYTDQWPFAASGIASVMVQSATADRTAVAYHTQYDTPDLVEWPYFAQMTKLEGDFMQRFDVGLLPYDFAARAAQLTSAVNPVKLAAAGADEDVSARLVADVASFGVAANAFAATQATIAPEEYRTANQRLLQVTRILNANLTAIPADFYTNVYPHEQTLKDILSMRQAVAALEAEPVDTVAAKKAIIATGRFWYAGQYFSPAVYRRDLAMWNANYDVLNFGALGHLAISQDLMPEYKMVGSGDYAGAIAGLNAKISVQVDDLNYRLAGMCETLEQVTPVIEAVAPITN